MPDVIDDLGFSGVASHGYSGWILIPSGVAVHSTLDAIAETLTHVSENKAGYSAWIRQPSGVNIPGIDEEIVFSGDILTNVCVATHTIDEVIVGTPTPEPVPVPTPGVGGGTYAPIFEEYLVLPPVEEIVTNAASSLFVAEELTTVEELITARVVNSNTVTGWYRKQTFTAFPILPEVKTPRVSHTVPKFKEELPASITASQRRKRDEEQMLLLDLF